MLERIPQSTAKRVVFKVFLSADHVTAGGAALTIPVQISKNGAGFANLATPANATSTGNGWYYIDLAIADTATLGPLIVRGTEATIDPAETVYEVVKATNAGFSALPDAAPGAAGGVFIAGTNAATTITTGLTTHLIGTVDTVTTLTGHTAQTGDSYAIVSSASYGNEAIRAVVDGLETPSTGTVSISGTEDVT